jgi:hypothetical protein
MTVTHMTRNGWHHTTISGTAAANGVHRTCRLTWRTQRVSCCGQTITLADDRQPAFIDHSWGDVHAFTKQCNTCGRVFVPVVYIDDEMPR